MQPILIDTDIGDDVDDALALAVALRSPEVELVGITTVFRNAPRRAILAREVLCLLGRQFETLDPALSWDDERHAVSYLVEQVRAHHERGQTLTLVRPLARSPTSLSRFIWRPTSYPNAASC